MSETKPPALGSPPWRFAFSLGDGIKTLLLSLIVYTCAFAYECGYCDQFSIPHDLISLDVTRFLVFAGKFVASLVVLSVLAAFLYIPIRFLPSKKRELVLFFKEEVLFILYGLTLFFLSGFYALILLIWIGGGFVCLVTQLLLLLRYKGSMRERVSALMQFLEKDPDFYKPFVERFGHSSVIFLLSLVALMASSYCVGLAEARDQRDVLVTTDSLVVLRVYGNRAICTPLLRGDLRDLDDLDTPFKWVRFRNDRPFEWFKVSPPRFTTKGVSHSTATQPTTSPMPSPSPQATPTPTLLPKSTLDTAPRTFRTD